MRECNSCPFLDRTLALGIGDCQSIGQYLRDSGQFSPVSDTVQWTDAYFPKTSQTMGERGIQRIVKGDKQYRI